MKKVLYIIVALLSLYVVNAIPFISLDIGDLATFNITCPTGESIGMVYHDSTETFYECINITGSNITTIYNITQNFTEVYNQTFNITNNITTFVNITQNFTVNVTVNDTLINDPMNTLAINFSRLDLRYVLWSIYSLENISLWNTLNLKLNYSDQRYNDTAYIDSRINGADTEIAYFSGNNIVSSPYMVANIEDGAQISLTDDTTDELLLYANNDDGTSISLRTDLNNNIPTIYWRDYDYSPYARIFLDNNYFNLQTSGLPFRFNNNISELSTIGENNFYGVTNQRGVLNMSSFITGGTYPNRALRMDLAANSGTPIFDLRFPVTNANINILEATAGSPYGVSDMFIQFRANTTAYTHIETVTGLGLVLGSAAGAKPIIFNVNRVVKAVLTNDYFNFTTPIIIQGRTTAFPSCTSNTAGAIEYNKSNNRFYGCNSTTWKLLDN